MALGINNQWALGGDIDFVACGVPECDKGVGFYLILFGFSLMVEFLKGEKKDE